MSVQELDSTIKIKCRLLKLFPCSILVLSWVISYQMITKWTFLKYTQEGLFKAAKIHKTKVLVETLYDQNLLGHFIGRFLYFYNFKKHFATCLRDIPNMDKCCQSKCCLEKCHSDSWNLLLMFTGPMFKV